MAGQVYAVASGKGGVGKTTTVINLGVVLRRADHTVALVDADLGMANLGTMLGISGEWTLHDVLAGEVSVEEALIEEAAGFGVLAGSGDLSSYPAAEPNELGDILDTLAEAYEFVIVDTGAGMSFEDVLPLGLADRIILVTTPEPAAIGDTRKTAELADLAEGSVGGLVVTMADDSTDVRQIAAEIGVDLLGVIPFDPTVRKSTATATPLEAVDPDGAAATAYREVATALTEASLTVEAEQEPVDTGVGDSGPEEMRSPSDEAEADTTPDEDVADAESAEPASQEAPAEGPEAREEPELAEQPVQAVDEAAEAEDEPGEEPDEEAPEEDEEDLDEYLEEFEDAEAESSGGLLSRLGRLFR